MPHPALHIPHVTTGRALAERQAQAAAELTWSRRELAGRLVELQATGAPAVLSASTALILDAQRAGEPVAWVAATDSLFFAPDLARSGVDVEAIALIRLRGARHAARGADALVRSGGFGLIILDLGRDAWFPTPLQSRLARSAEEHDATVLCLTLPDPGPLARDKGTLSPSAVSLRAEASLRATNAAPHMEESGRFHVVLQVVKDRRRGPGWSDERLYRGATGLR